MIEYGFAPRGFFGIRIRNQLGREMAFSRMQPKCSPEEFFNKIGTKPTKLGSLPQVGSLAMNGR
jgi:hypothetical protein